MVQELVDQGPDLDLASTWILDFSVPQGFEERRLRRTLIGDLPTISISQRNAVLAVFADGVGT